MNCRIVQSLLYFLLILSNTDCNDHVVDKNKMYFIE